MNIIYPTTGEEALIQIINKSGNFYCYETVLKVETP